MATAKTGLLFTVYTMLDSLSAGYMPAVQSLALGIYASRGGQETGKLFGGLSVVQALGYGSVRLRCEYISYDLGLQWLHHLSDAFRLHVLQDGCDLPASNVHRRGLGCRTRPSLHPLY